MKLQIKSKLASIHDKSDVLDENGNLLYRVHSRALSIHDKTYIEDASGNRSGLYPRESRVDPPCVLR